MAFTFGLAAETVTDVPGEAPVTGLACFSALPTPPGTPVQSFSTAISTVAANPESHLLHTYCDHCPRFGSLCSVLRHALCDVDIWPSKKQSSKERLRESSAMHEGRNTKIAPFTSGMEI